uniref:UBA domain-containing protein n=1 Tax=Rhipicephalus pulchellus TaxID=72859 RepID=L7M1Q1_RHIPC
MGFPATNARHALQQANNDINVAIQILQQPPQQEQQLPTAASGTSVASSSSSSAAQSVLGVNQAVWAQLAQQSISTDMWATLTRLGIDLEVVCEALCRNNGDVDATLSELLGDSENADDEKERDAMQRLAHDISVNEEDFLDVSLDEELSYLKEYEAKLASLGH